MWQIENFLPVSVDESKAILHIVIELAPVVRKLDSAIHRINRYPEDKYYDIQLRYPVDSNLSSG